MSLVPSSGKKIANQIAAATRDDASPVLCVLVESVLLERVDLTTDDEPAKQYAALALLSHLKLNAHGVISTQVLQEFANVALRKMKLDAHHVRSQLAAHEQFEVVQITPRLIRGALDLHQTRSLSFYDALIVHAASVSGCDTLYSEALNSGEIVDGVTIVNPFTTKIDYAVLDSGSARSRRSYA